MITDFLNTLTAKHPELVDNKPSVHWPASIGGYSVEIINTKKSTHEAIKKTTCKLCTGIIRDCIVQYSLAERFCKLCHLFARHLTGFKGDQLTDPGTDSEGNANYYPDGIFNAQEAATLYVTHCPVIEKTPDGEKPCQSWSGSTLQDLNHHVHEKHAGIYDFTWFKQTFLKQMNSTEEGIAQSETSKNNASPTELQRVAPTRLSDDLPPEDRTARGKLEATHRLSPHPLSDSVKTPKHIAGTEPQTVTFNNPLSSNPEVQPMDIEQTNDSTSTHAAKTDIPTTLDEKINWILEKIRTEIETETENSLNQRDKDITDFLKICKEKISSESQYPPYYLKMFNGELFTSYANQTIDNWKSLASVFIPKEERLLSKFERKIAFIKTLIEKETLYKQEDFEAIIKFLDSDCKMQKSEDIKHMTDRNFIDYFLHMKPLISLWLVKMKNEK